MAHFTTLKYKNVQSVGNHPITIQLDRNQNTLIGGNNGSGKSTMLFAFTYGLFGKFPNGAKLADAINSTNKKNLLVEIEFSTRGDDYKIVRGEKPKKFEIYKNDELIEQDARASDYQKKLDGILGMDYMMFTQVVMLNKEQYKPFMSLSTAERRKVVEDILGISIFSVMNKICKEKIKQNNNDVTNQENAIEITRNKISSQKEVISTIKDSQESLEKETQEEIDSLDEDSERVESEIKEIDSKIDELLDFSKLDKVKKQKRELQDLGTNFEHNINAQERILKFFNENDVCPTCEQDIDEGLKANKIDSSERVIQENKNHISELLGTIEEIVSKENKLKSAKERYNELRSERRTLENELSIIERNRSKLVSKLNEKSDDNAKLNEAVSKYETLEEQLSEQREVLASLIDKSDLLERLRNVLKDDGVKAVIIKEYIDLINKKLNEYLQAMNFYINMTLDENFKESFAALNKENFTMSNLSTGQKSRVNLAIWLALLEVASIKNSVVSNVLLLDEILENLDQDGVKDFMNLCKEMLTDKNVFIITQRYDEFMDYFHSSIRFKLEEGFTEFEEE
tara:strand:- start:71378 stop:73087 length:1710 start_codon:yes stop_codon:yes gene_type:complete